MIAKSKKSQAEVIVTVLIILLVLTIVGIVANMVIKTVREGTGEAEKKAECLSVRLNIDKIKDKEITISRSVGGGNVSSYIVILDGKRLPVEGSPLLELDSKTYTYDGIKNTSKVQVAAILEGGVTCDVTGTIN